MAYNVNRVDPETGIRVPRPFQRSVKKSNPNYGDKNAAAHAGRLADPTDRFGEGHPAKTVERAKEFEAKRMPGVLDDPSGAFFSKLSELVEGRTGDSKTAYDSLDFYAEYVMAWRNPEYVKPSSVIRSIYNELQNTDDDLIILAPRNSAKSSAVTITWVSWMIGRNPLLRFLLSFAVKEKQGEAFLRQLKQIITHNERYIEIFGELKPKQPEKWDETELIVERPTPPSGLKDSSVYICGLGTAVPSKRADIIICDDLVTQENAYSETQRKNVIDFVLRTLFPILVPGGRRVVVGTTWDPRDLYAYLAEAWRLNIPAPDPDVDLNELLQYYEEDDEVREITFDTQDAAPDPIAELMLGVAGNA